MQDEFSKYEAMKSAGLSPEQIYCQAVADGIDPIARIRLIRTVFGLSMRQAKDVILRAEGVAESAQQLQSSIADALPQAPLISSAENGVPTVSEPAE